MDDDDVATEEDETLALDDGAMLDDDAATEEDEAATDDETATLDNGGVSEELEKTATLDSPVALDPGITEMIATDDEVPVTLDLPLTLDKTLAEESPLLAIVPESYAQLRMHPVIANRPKKRPNLDFIILAFVTVYCEVHACCVWMACPVMEKR